jgi:glycosyltransferase involved in cell wall biosynthesis
MTRVSVVIPCFNARRWIRATVESVLEQAIEGLEIIVVDDGSTDGSARFISQQFPDIRLVQTDNGGASRARNIGTRLASGQFIQYLDADDLLTPGKLDAQLRAMLMGRADVVYGDWRELRAGADGVYRPGRPVARSIEGDPPIALVTDFWCPPAAYLFRRDIVDRAGGWDEQQPVVEDVRFVLSCALHGAEFRYMPGVSALYRVHEADSLSTADPTAFTRGCLRNAAMLEEWWTAYGGLGGARSAALLRVLSQVARASYGRDQATFDAALASLEHLQPGYTPAHPWHLALVARLVGYRSAEGLALRYRRAKHTLRAALQPAQR